MCIIAVKKAGVEMPDRNTLANMFKRNPNGAGFMYARNGYVIVRKGFMNFESFEQAVNAIPEPTKTPVVLHCRITTHGGTCRELTHPFVISDKLDDLMRLGFRTTRTCMAHNGIIRSVNPPKGVSDTQQFILDFVQPLQDMNSAFMYDERALRMLEMAAGSKLAFLNRFGDIKLVGDFQSDLNTGMIYSNGTYMPYVQPTYKTYNASAKRYVYPYSDADVKYDWECDRDIPF